MYKFIVVLLTALLISNAWGKTLTCKDGYVKNGDSTGKVFKVCGKPEFRDITSSDGARTKTETWMYDGINEGMIFFKNGKIVRIKR